MSVDRRIILIKPSPEQTGGPVLWVRSAAVVRLEDGQMAIVFAAGENATGIKLVLAEKDWPEFQRKVEQMRAVQNETLR
jgi:hypothetical protein